ncbi:hypothetical protein GMORB2_0121 [Geosmithia morbida]|uniref:Uncharacterized protein n=1 Tax=Geosmithia morbida TaxID=1094350 RepID=A0A9P4Z298_9HYPO|nr:uncharacterized protein GMORB2_0121 [Geosmithia morbida]KAF4126385.1 hypothetical protein GMORB2_0121 [Geosmithia morbida]
MSTDEELDRNWQPNGRRPQSTMARTFSQELMDIFRIENSLTDLDSQVDQRKQHVTKSNDELASLEARLKEMESRLKKSQQRMSMSQVSLGSPKPFSVPAAASSSQQQQQLDAPVNKDDSKSRSRPGTARATQQAPSAGDMPPTPGGSEDGDHE